MRLKKLRFNKKPYCFFLKPKFTVIKILIYRLLNIIAPPYTEKMPTTKLPNK